MTSRYDPLLPNVIESLGFDGRRCRSFTRRNVRRGTRRDCPSVVDRPRPCRAVRVSLDDAPIPDSRLSRTSASCNVRRGTTRRAKRHKPPCHNWVASMTERGEAIITRAGNLSAAGLPVAVFPTVAWPRLPLIEAQTLVGYRRIGQAY